LEPYPYDPEKAKELLAQAGLADGFDLTLEVPAGRYLKGEEISQAAAADWAKVGINTKVVKLEWSVYAPKITREKNPDGVFLLGLASAWNVYDDMGNFHPDHVFAPYYWTDQEYLDLLDSYPTADTAGRQEASYRLQEILHDSGPAVLLWRQVQIYGVNVNVDWEPRPDDYIIGEDFK
jgi:peptide/nickel transport system substrate-binding protein